MSYTIWGSFNGAPTQYIRPYIEVSWTQNIVNNTSSVTASLIFHRYTNNYWSYNELTNSNGHSSTFKIGSSSLTQIRPFNLQRQNPPNWVTVWTRTRTIQHNSDGTATVNISASGDTNVNPRNYSFGETVTLPTIPRQTTITSVSMANELSPSVANSLSVNISRKHSTYSHRFEIMSGSTVLQTTTGNVPTSITVSSDTVNKMIDLMPTVVSREFTFRVTTLNSSGNVVGRTTKNFTVRLNDETTSPTIIPSSPLILGSGHDNSIGKFVQNISRVRAQFFINPGRRATIQGASVRVGNVSVSGRMLASGETYRADSNTLQSSSTITITMTATNSRGQSTSDTRDITVHAYSPPSITSFTTNRSTSNATNVIVTRQHSFTSLGGDNTVTAKVERRLTSGTSWSEVNTSNSSNLSTTITGNVASSSYVFRTTVTDAFGNSATSEDSLGTASVLQELYRDVGISVGQRFDPNNPSIFQVGGNMSLRDKQGRTLNLLNPQFHSANMLNGYGTRDWGGNVVGYYKVGGVVHLTGMVTLPSSTTNADVLFTLPEGFRPGYRIVGMAYTAAGVFYRVDVYTNGDVVWWAGAQSMSWLSLEGIIYVAEG